MYFWKSFPSPWLPQRTRTSGSATTAGGSSVERLITPPAAFPYSDEAGPRITSTRPIAARSMLFCWLCPSGSVSGIPSTSIFTPRTPNCARLPNPRIEIRDPRAKLYLLFTQRPATSLSDSSSPTVLSACWIIRRSTTCSAYGARFTSARVRVTVTVMFSRL